MEPKDRQTPPDARAQHRAFVLEHVVNGGLTIEQAAAILRLSTRQVGRLLIRHAGGPAALAHGNRGRTPANRLDDARRTRLVGLATTTYAGVNHTHLAEREGIVIAPRTLRRILAEASVRPARTRRPARHRSRRERMAREGQLLQTDGSRHRWFGPERPFATLVGAIDDATSRVTGAPSGRPRTPSATSRRSPRRPTGSACRAGSIPTATGSSPPTGTGRRRSPSSSPASAA